MVAACSLKSQRNNRQNALAADSIDGKAGEKAVFSPCCGDETIMTEPFHAKGKALPQQMIVVFSEKPKRQPIKRLTHKVAYSRLKNGKLKKSA